LSRDRADCQFAGIGDHLSFGHSCRWQPCGCRGSHLARSGDQSVFVDRPAPIQWLPAWYRSMSPDLCPGLFKESLLKLRRRHSWHPQAHRMPGPSDST
jgi:hypothetical protein